VFVPRPLVRTIAGVADYALDVHPGLLLALQLSVAAHVERWALRVALLVGACEQAATASRPGAALSVVCVSVSSVGVTRDAEAGHALEIRIELALGTLSTRIGHGL